jgi:hypothetical protein
MIIDKITGNFQHQKQNSKSIWKIKWSIIFAPQSVHIVIAEIERNKRTRGHSHDERCYAEAT